jgi:very-short-patch-repair endonuclease
MGAVLWLGGRAAVSGKAAALDWGLDGIDEARPELSTTGHRQTKSGLIIVHRVLRLDDDEIVLRGRLPVTAVPRTLVDLGRGVAPSTLEVAAESAIRRRLATRDQIARALERAGTTTPGRAVLATVIAQRRTTGSFLEVLAWQLIRDFGLPFPVRQFEVELPAGPRWIDLAYPAERIAIELDGFESHSSKRDVERDRLRQNALVRQGWTVYRATKRDLVHRRTQVALDIKGLLAQRRSRFAAG